jgi:hypothetical protein
MGIRRHRTPNLDAIPCCKSTSASAPSTAVTLLRMMTPTNLKNALEGNLTPSHASSFGAKNEMFARRMGIPGQPDEIELSGSIVANLSIMLSHKKGKYECGHQHYSRALLSILYGVSFVRIFFRPQRTLQLTARFNGMRVAHACFLRFS